ncbi:xylooligosaccharide oxidase-like [Folsomia candida]|uniref:xylooligosaccharide oxidase-like n=1 Tax=Folsomia candida TaxID=158441 RepID=UPI0016054376|nr:xylooligosaccharide oxidase-like [Folsomia candida]
MRESTLVDILLSEVPPMSSLPFAALQNEGSGLLSGFRGGHSYEEYSFGDNTTFIVDLRHMFEMYVSPDRSWFSIGAGALLGQIAYPLLEQYNLLTPHGTCPTVGITGLATGGGYENMSKLHGLTVDNILEVEIVSPNGSQLIVNEQTYPDLFWALRGAGSDSFGIITKLTFKAYQAPVLVTAGEIIYP